jgi:hypothetical protein
MNNRISGLTLRIHDVPQLHDNMASEFGVCKRHVHTAGEQVPDALLFTGEEQWPNNLFAIESPIASANPSDHWHWLRDLLVKHDKMLHDVERAGGKMDVHFSLFMPPGSGSFAIPESCIELLAKHRLSLFFRIVSDPVFKEEGQAPMG